MAKEYIKLNNSDEHLSLGNLFRIIKELSKNKRAALQTEIFCTIFDIDNINDTTVNNYCLGARSIGSDYKEIYLKLQKKYNNDYEIFCDIIINLLSIIDGTIYDIKNKKIDFINKNSSMRMLCKKMYNLAKNDNDVNNKLVTNISGLINEEKYYECLVLMLLFIILEKKQPIFESNLKKEVLENILNDTSISAKSLEEYLDLKLKEGINYDLSMKILADKENAYACYELGCNEYYGYYKGYPRYDEAYKYFLKAAGNNHASACYMIGNILIKGLIGKKTKKELSIGYDYLVKASNLGNVAAINMIGNMYYEGIYPLNKNLIKAKESYLDASKANYVYAFNNLGRMYENDNDLDKAYEYYLKSANLGESWSCNKMGNYYWEKDDIDNAYKYWNKAIESNHHTLCYYAYYNLAKYFYLFGYLNYGKDKDKAINYLYTAHKHNIIDATILLLLVKIGDYKDNKNKALYKEIMELVSSIEDSSEYNERIRDKVEELLFSIKNKKEINRQIIEDLL